jgi:hypothetical protein
LDCSGCEPIDRIAELEAELSKAHTHNGELLTEQANSVPFDVYCDKCEFHDFDVDGLCFDENNETGEYTKQTCQLLNKKGE